MRDRVRIKEPVEVEKVADDGTLEDRPNNPVSIPPRIIYLVPVCQKRHLLFKQHFIINKMISESLELKLIKVLCQTITELVQLLNYEKEQNPEVEQLKVRHKCLREYIPKPNLQRLRPFSSQNWMLTLLDLCDAKEDLKQGLTPLLTSVWKIKREFNNQKPTEETQVR